MTTTRRALVAALSLVVSVLAPTNISPAYAASGKCGFEAAEFSFAGDAVTQARCLLRHVRMYAHLDTDPAALPGELEELIGKPTDNVADSVRSHMAASDYAAGIPGGSLASGLSHANGGSGSAPQARYFVIHDTSSPYFGNDAFPSDIDTSSAVNRLSGHGGSNSKAHLFINRKGEWLAGHDFSVPWRATKLELDVVGTPAKGLFIHIELIQPRRRDPNGGANNDAIAPDPGFTAAQYDVLSIAYIAASVRAGTWLIPAFHAALDEGLNDGHDDPQNFDLAAFGLAVATSIKTMTEE